MTSSTRPLKPGVPPAPGRYVLDPTAATFTTRHLFGMAEVSGTIAVTSGEIRVGEPISASTAEVILDATSFTTGNPKRDADVTGQKFLDAASLPRMTFSGVDVSWR